MPIKNPPHPGDFIRTEIIQPAGLSVTAAAAALKVSRPALSSLLNGKASLSGDMALRIEKAFGVKMDTLMRMQSAYDIARTRLRNFSLLHGLGQLPRHDLLDGLSLRFFEDVFLLQEVVNARSQILLAHCSNSFCRLRARVKSSSGVALVFLINPCNATSRSWKKQIKTRAVRLFGRSVRTSHSPLRSGRQSGIPTG